MSSPYSIIFLLAVVIQRSEANFPLAGYFDQPAFGFHEPPHPYPYVGETSAPAPIVNALLPAPAYPFDFPYFPYSWYSRLFEPRMPFHNVGRPFPREKGLFSDSSFFPPLAAKA